MTEKTQSRKLRTGVRVVISTIVVLLLLGGAVGASYLIFESEPTAQQESTTKRTAALVEVMAVQRGRFTPRLSVLGVVEPAKELSLSPRVSGEVIELEKGLIPRGIVQQNEPLLRIDPVDFEQEVITRRSQLQQVEAELRIEQGQQEIARREFELLGEDLDPANRSLVLREPQIESIRARILAAEAALRRAELDLERTRINAPFDAQVLSRSVHIGSQVSTGEELAHLVGVDEYWVIATLALKDIRWIDFEGSDSEGARVHIRQSTSWPVGVQREGRVGQLIGSVDQSTRLGRVLVKVPDPLGRESDSPPLILGTIVQVEIEASPLEDVVRLDRAYLRQDNTLWIMSPDNQLQLRRVEVLFADARFAYIGDGGEEGEFIVTTSLATVVDGLPLRLEEDSEVMPAAGSTDES